MKYVIVILMVLAIVGDSAWGATVRITWDANNEPDVYGYKLYYGTASGGPYSTVIDVGNVTTKDVVISPLAGARFYFALSAYNDAGESSLSDEVNIIVPGTIPPAKPRGIRAIISRIIAGK
jgi:hypothetical protein